jgi:hypothetical protein
VLCAEISFSEEEARDNIHGGTEQAPLHVDWFSVLQIALISIKSPEFYELI